MSAWKFFHSIQRLTTAGNTKHPVSVRPQTRIQYSLSGRTSNAAVIQALQHCDYSQLNTILDSLSNPSEIEYQTWADDGGFQPKEGN